MSVPIPPVSVLESCGKLFFRPTLQITDKGPYTIEEVAVPALNAKAKYIRAWVHNLFGFPAGNCHVMVNRILLNGRVIDAERSELQWKDYDIFEVPAIRRGYKNGYYVNICAAYSTDSLFQVISHKWTKGYHRYDKTGVYRLELTAEAEKPCSFGHFVIDVGYDSADWRALEKIGTQAGPGLLRLR
jgi:hypothetical protein